MKKTKKTKVKVKETPVIPEKVLIGKLSSNFNQEELNKLVDKVNELIDHANGVL